MYIDSILSEIQSIIQTLFYLVVSLFVIILLKGSDDFEKQENEESERQKNIQSDIAEQESN